MSRAFVKESDSDQATDVLPDRPRSSHTNYVTPAGLSQLRERWESLLRAKAELAGRDDLASRQQAQAIERDLRYYQDRVETAVLVDPRAQSDERVHFGATVDVLDEDDVRHRFTIVGEDEADVAQGMISWVSPLAAALRDASVGDVVRWPRPAGDRELEVIAIHSGEPAS